ncbi:MAG: PQQ-binding-like beta-propeller repeat protein [Rhodospirillaceae bacterium]|nr:PQQ-binding-like beta-propeller repeat protein [Rhodospirillaceae bacterium]
MVLKTFYLRVSLLTASALVLGACSTWFGAEEEPRLPGKRVSVLLHETGLIPDADETEAGTQIRLPAPSPTPDWPQNGGYANHAMHHILAAPRLSKVWSTDIGSGASSGSRFTTAPIVAGGLLYAIDTESVVSAFDAQSGKRIWRMELTPDREDDGHIQGGIAFENGRVFAGTGFAEVIALDGKSGEQIWRRKVSGPIRSAPTVRGGRVFTTTIDNRLHALSVHDGATLWNHSGSQEDTILLGTASPAVSEGVVVVPYTSGEVVALKVENGRQLWSMSLSSGRRTNASSLIAQIRGNPVIDRGRVFVSSNSGLMASIDLRTGNVIWEKNVGGYQSPWVAGDYIFSITGNQELAALERSSGRVIWVNSLPNFNNPDVREEPIVWNGPLLVSDRLIVVSSEGAAVAISPYSGRVIGSEKMPDGVSVSPIAAGNSVYFLANNATLVAYR